MLKILAQVVSESNRATVYNYESKFNVFNHIPFEPDRLADVELTHRQAKELLEELAAQQEE